MNRLKDKVAIVTGSTSGIGAAMARLFAKEGATVVICGRREKRGNALAQEIKKNGGKAMYHFLDLTQPETITALFADTKEKLGKIDVLVNNALPLMKGIDECSYEEFSYALAVGVTAPFYLAKLFAPHFGVGASIINISSSRDRMSQPQTESYTAAKGGIAALTHALAVSFAGRVRVNSISPGWIDTDFKVYDGADATQQPAGRVGNPLDISNMVLFLASEKAGFITGENICIDGGMTRQMIYHNDCGWTYSPSKDS